MSIYDAQGVGVISAISGGECPAPLPVSKSVALVGTGLRAARQECHRRHGWRVVRDRSGPDFEVRYLSVSDAPKGGAFGNTCSLSAQF